MTDTTETTTAADTAAEPGTATSTPAGSAATESAAPKTASHDNEPSPKLRAFMNSGWADSERQDVTLSDVGVWAAKRRDALSQAFPGERLVVPAGTYKVRSNDTDYVFRPHTDYVWLAGDQTSDAVLVLEPNGTSGHDSVLYFRPRSDRGEGEEFWRDRMYGELWAGRRPSLTETAKEFGIETRHVDRLADALKGDVPTRVRRGEDASLTSVLSGAKTDADRDQELAATLSKLRLVKDPFELEQLRDAVAITHRGFSDVLAEMDKVREYGERWIEGTFWRRARAEGNDVGYTSIAAAGQHATTLHWIENDGAVTDGTLMLLDMGVENRRLYTADITRTLPVNGEFTRASATSTNWCWTGRTRASPRSGRAPRSAPRTRPRWRSSCTASTRWTCCRSRRKRRWTRRAGSTSGTRCTGSATCSVSTSTTAPRPATRTTARASWRPATC